MDKPNFLIIMSDEHDPQISSPYGHTFVETPNMQRLADSGATFDNAYCNSPICVPSRASFMTGKHLHRIGVWDNSVPLSSDEPTWAHRLNKEGYETALCGKMHFVGPDQMHGFSRRIMDDIHGMGGIGSNLPNWTDGGFAKTRGDEGGLRRRLAEDPGPGDHEHQQYDDEVVMRSIQYLAEPARKEKPWALVSSIFTPHFPFTARPEYYHKYAKDHADLPDIPEGHLESLHEENRRLRHHFEVLGIPDEQIRKARAAYYGLVDFCDDKIGDILDALDAYGLADNTVVIYTADHGEMLGDHGMWYKCTFYERSSRVPLIVRWPGVTKPGQRYKQVTSLLDVVQTMLDATGADNEFTDGDSLLPLMSGETSESEGMAICEYYAHGSSTPRRMVRRGNYKLNHYHGQPPELFNLEKDPNELMDISGDPDCATLVSELTEIALDGWDGESIHHDIIQSQQQRLLIAAAMESSGDQWGPPWRNGNYG